MTQLRNQHGVTHVGLTKNRVQYRRSVTLLVATAFLAEFYKETFDAPINLDGDRSNNRVENLVWRPRWFAVKYHQQFKDNTRRGFLTPIRETKTGEEFESSWEAAIKYGLLDREILLATINNTYVWPTYQRFQTIG